MEDSCLVTRALADSKEDQKTYGAEAHSQEAVQSGLHAVLVTQERLSLHCREALSALQYKFAIELVSRAAHNLISLVLLGLMTTLPLYPGLMSSTRQPSCCEKGRLGGRDTSTP